MSASPYWIGFGDVHNSFTNLARIPGLAEAAGIIVSGDLTVGGGRREAKLVMDAVRATNPMVYAQIGNMDLREVTTYLEELGANIHVKAVELAPGAGLIGVGMSMHTPFGTPSETTDTQLGDWLEEAYAQANFEHLLLVAHNPPADTSADVVGGGRHVGSQTIRAFIERVKPQVCLTGHIHEARSQDELAGCTIINPGTLGGGGYAVITLTDGGFVGELRMV